MMWIRIILICECILFLTKASSPAFKEYPCQSKSQNVHLHLASKTPYRFLVNKNDSSPAYKGCMPQKIWMLFRHGTRNPSEKVIIQMREQLPILQSLILKKATLHETSLCDKEIARFANWSVELEVADEKRLTHEGEDEMIELAERFQNRFYNLLPEDYNNSSIKFRHTATQRAAESARHFTVGLFGRRVSRYVWYPEALYKDPILRFYKLCPRWRSQIKKNPEAWKEKQIFENGQEMNATLEDIRRRIGIANISFDDVVLMYVTCAFETAWYRKSPSPWCTVFSERNLEVMEYHADMEKYWVDGYGHDLTFKQACPVIDDVFSFFEGRGAWAGADAVGAVASFTHSGTLLKLLAHLGLYRDAAALRHDNFAQHRARQWRVSRIDAFASNIAFVLYGCGAEQRVLALHQERPVTLPGCPAAPALCPLPALRAAFHSSLDCRFQQMCSLHPNTEL